MTAMANDASVLELLERVRNRFYGKYRGTVTAVDGNALKIKAKVPAVLGQQPTNWCLPCVPYAGKGVGMAFMPEEGAAVWIEFEGGDVSYPIWAGCFWRDGEKPSEAGATVKTFVTEAEIRIVSGTDDPDSRLVLSTDGATLQRSGNKVSVSSEKVDVNDGGLEVT